MLSVRFAAGMPAAMAARTGSLPAMAAASPRRSRTQSSNSLAFNSETAFRFPLWASNSMAAARSYDHRPRAAAITASTARAA